MADVVVDLENKNSKELLNLGIRAYILQDYTSAVQALSKASEILVSEHNDDLHDSLGDVYLYYGKSLLSLSRQEAELLGDAIPKDAESDTEEEEEDGESVPEKGAEVTEKSEEKEKVGATGDDKPVDNAKPTEQENKTENLVNGNVEDGPSSSAAEPPADEDPTDLQVAWEVLELAKKIFEKRGETGKKHLADCLTVLGEVSLENENFEGAINDMKQGLEIQVEIYSKDSRKIAQTYYNLGIAYSINSQIDEALESFDKSLEYLNNRVNTLEKDENGTEEIKEIKELIPELEEKIIDMKTYKEEATKKIAELAKQLTSSSSDKQSNVSKPVTNISHLVKRKRKPDEADSEDTVPVKKPSL